MIIFMNKNIWFKVISDPDTGSLDGQHSIPEMETGPQKLQIGGIIMNIQIFGSPLTYVSMYVSI